jgi:hypothetical protein
MQAAPRQLRKGRQCCFGTRRQVDRKVSKQPDMQPSVCYFESAVVWAVWTVVYRRRAAAWAASCRGTIVALF